MDIFRVVLNRIPLKISANALKKENMTDWKDRLGRQNGKAGGSGERAGRQVYSHTLPYLRCSLKRLALL